MFERDREADLERESLISLGRMLFRLIPAGGAAIELRVTAATRDYTEQLATVTFDDGTAKSRHVGIDICNVIDAVRDQMYRVGAGTWYSATFVVTAQGSMDAQYDYDDEPDWLTPVTAGTYGRDLEKYPRDPERTPAWLREKLERAEAEKVDGQWAL